MLVTFLSKVTYTISNILLLLHTRSRITYTNLTLIPLYSGINIKLVEVNYIEY
jgi:hypothetical protein